MKPFSFLHVYCVIVYDFFKNNNIIFDWIITISVFTFIYVISIQSSNIE